ncbi:serine/threonine-protein kinase 19 isoform X4 [Pipistrellus kuhlii]|uniref:serine/threonine-protein kinase 19 isoform X4 n=1 Tax=Pipistrellus kuhlii TaxID=59472 RepID=UPI001E272350|nr:serine/threonine-protein kinase 19 isoform X4 [Pipistrellus kuhlii]
MSRKRPRPGAEPLGLRRRRAGGRAEADAPGGAAGARGAGGGPPGPGAARAAVAELGRLFPRGLFEDALPPIALRSQVYSLVPDRTAADRQLRPLARSGGKRHGGWPAREGQRGLQGLWGPFRSVSPQTQQQTDPSSKLTCSFPLLGEKLPASHPDTLLLTPSFWKQKELQEQGEIRVIQLGFDLDAHGIVLTEDYRTRVRVARARGRRLSQATPPPRAQGSGPQGLRRPGLRRGRAEVPGLGAPSLRGP